MYYYYCCIVFHDFEWILLSTVRRAGYMLECTTHVDLCTIVLAYYIAICMLRQDAIYISFNKLLYALDWHVETICNVIIVF